MAINLNSVRDVLISFSLLGLGAVVWEAMIKPSIGGFINFFYAGKLEDRKSRSARELEQLRMELLRSFEEIKHRNLKDIEEIKRSFDSALKQQEMQFDAQLKSKISVDETLFNKELPLYEEMNEIVYRCRNLARECLAVEKINLKVLSDFSLLKFHLTENLFKYKAVSSENIFDKLHRFKVEIQEYSILLDVVTRSTHVDDAPVNPQIREFAEAQMQIRYATIDSLYQEISLDIKNHLKERRL